MDRDTAELLVRTGPGTAMGALMRRYWVPVLLASEIAAPDCPPVRVKILGEKLLAFRDTQGRAGLIDEFCAHRGATRRATKSLVPPSTGTMMRTVLLGAQS